MMLIEICINCFRYEHRLNWLLSSLIQQRGNIPRITVNISHMLKAGNPPTEEVCEFFRKQGLDITETIADSQKEVSARGPIRNKQLANCKADFILFADCDMVYDSYFFSDLKQQLEGKLKDVDKCMTADRISLDIDFCTKYFREDQTIYPCVVKNVSDIVSKWPIFRVSGSRVGPGNFQLANMKCVRQKGIPYTHHCRDIWRSTRSDKHFRKNMGGILPIITKKMFHLNHDRGGPEEQR